MNSSFVYNEDTPEEFEKLPKTDYTYAKSMSYNRMYAENCSFPNMSRRSLRHQNGQQHTDQQLIDNSSHKQQTTTNNSSYKQQTTTHSLFHQPPLNTQKHPIHTQISHNFLSTPQTSSTHPDLSTHFQHLSHIDKSPPNASIPSDFSTSTTTSCYNLRSRQAQEIHHSTVVKDMEEWGGGGGSGDDSIYTAVKKNISTNTPAFKKAATVKSSQRSHVRTSLNHSINRVLEFFFYIVSSPFYLLRYLFTTIKYIFMNDRGSRGGSYNGGSQGGRGSISSYDLHSTGKGVGVIGSSSENVVNKNVTVRNRVASGYREKISSFYNYNDHIDGECAKKKEVFGTNRTQAVAGDGVMKKRGVLKMLTETLMSFLCALMSFLIIVARFITSIPSRIISSKSHNKSNKRRSCCSMRHLLLTLLLLLAAIALFFWWTESSSSSSLLDNIPSAQQIHKGSGTVLEHLKNSTSKYLWSPACLMTSAMWAWLSRVQMPDMWSGSGGKDVIGDGGEGSTGGGSQEGSYGGGGGSVRYLESDCTQKTCPPPSCTMNDDQMNEVVKKVILEMNTHFAQKKEGVEKRFKGVEGRIGEMEGKMGGVEGRVEEVVTKIMEERLQRTREEMRMMVKHVVEETMKGRVEEVVEKNHKLAMNQLENRLQESKVGDSESSTAQQEQHLQQQQQLQQQQIDLNKEVEVLVLKKMTMLMQERMEEMNDGLKKDLDEKLQSLPTIPSPTSAPSPANNHMYYTKEESDELLEARIERYDADKTGLVDFALESAGGSLRTTRCSKTYRGGMAQLSMFGIPLFYVYNSPRTILQPGSLPGQCWAFQGGMGFAVVQLAAKVFVKQVSIEHISKSISTLGNIDSAPKDFSVWGLSNEDDVNGSMIGNFTYDINSPSSLQFFHIPQQEQQQVSYELLELRIYNNHGNRDYTCVYRFRVHGVADVDEKSRSKEGGSGGAGWFGEWW